MRNDGVRLGDVVVLVVDVTEDSIQNQTKESIGFL